MERGSFAALSFVWRGSFGVGWGEVRVVRGFHQQIDYNNLGNCYSQFIELA